MVNYVEEILNRSRDIHLKKREDYATNPTADPFENFDRSAEIARWFPVTYSSFAVLIGTKLARLGSLLVTGKAPNNESIDDTFLDLVTYCALFYAYWKAKQTSEWKYDPIIKSIEFSDGKGFIPLACKGHSQFILNCAACLAVNKL